MQAKWNGEILAESNETKIIEGNHYFPPDAIREEFFHHSETHTHCPWKGVASYYTIKVNDKENRDAAWYYPETSDLAKEIKGYIAFWKGVEVS